MGMGFGSIQALQPGGWNTAAINMANQARAQGGTPLGEAPVRTQAPYIPPTQTSQYANPVPQYAPSSFNITPYAQAYQQQFGQNMSQLGQSLPPVQAPQTQAPQQVSGLGALAQLYGMYNAAPKTAEAQGTHAASLAAAANTSI